jgi:hypothetical protein
MVLRYNDANKYNPALLYDVLIWLQRHGDSIPNFIRDARAQLRRRHGLASSNQQTPVRIRLHLTCQIS